MTATKPLYDYGKLYASDGSFEVLNPASADELQAALEASAARGQALRVRGSAHTFNGCTLPQAGELLIRTADLDHFHFDRRGSIQVGAGSLVWDIRDLIASYELQMPVYNGGWAGPTLGGYINAGGFGKGSLSDAHGGLWENVLTVDLLDPQGNLHTIGRDDPRFAWLFGAYGQFGVVVGARLKVLADNPLAMLAYPMNLSGRVPRRQVDDPADNDSPCAADASKLFWFSLLVAPEQEQHAWDELADFCQRHQGVVVPEGGWAGPLRDGEPIGYHYNIRFHEFNPPLLYPLAEDFIVMGVMARFACDRPEARESILDIEREFIALARRNRFRLYLQAENIGRNVDYRDYYGDEVFKRFRELKREFDPEYRLNTGLIDFALDDD